MEPKLANELIFNCDKSSTPLSLMSCFAGSSFPYLLRKAITSQVVSLMVVASGMAQNKYWLLRKCTPKGRSMPKR